MKKLLLTVILLAGIVTGVVHIDYSQHATIENILTEQTYMIPDVIIDPLFDPVPY